MEIEMKKYNYGCDAGILLIGNKECLMYMPNGYGDGGFNVLVAEQGDVVTEGFRFVTAIKGQDIKLYDYDCLDYEELDEHVICTLSGRYGVYNYDGDIFIERWSD